MEGCRDLLLEFYSYMKIISILFSVYIVIWCSQLSTTYVKNMASDYALKHIVKVPL